LFQIGFDPKKLKIKLIPEKGKMGIRKPQKLKNSFFLKKKKIFLADKREVMKKFLLTH
jgi:hypothetical protein